MRNGAFSTRCSPIGANERGLLPRTGAAWRDMPEQYGNWNSVFIRFTCWSKLGVWDAATKTLPRLGPLADKEHAIDSTIVRAHQHAASVKGESKSGSLRRSRGGFSTKIHLRTNAMGYPLTFDVTGGEAHEVKDYDALMELQRQGELGDTCIDRRALVSC
jgi:hypothetical protein